eukprot:3118496-Karenia_brevis.AAC.1
MSSASRNVHKRSMGCDPICMPHPRFRQRAITGFSANSSTELKIEGLIGSPCFVPRSIANSLLT